MTKVKICGLSEPETLRAAVRAGADWIGFMFVENSPRAVTPAAAASLLLGIGNAVPVAVVSDASADLLDEISELQFPVIQLHGTETPEQVATLKNQTGAEIWKAIGVQTASDLTLCDRYAAADRLLIDAKAPDGADYAGGHGTSFDWSILKDWDAPKPWLLAGGLKPENVKDAIAATGATAVDVSSGVERARGLKDAALIEAFLQAAKVA